MAGRMAAVPAHDGRGRLHLCFGMEAGEVSGWETHLRTLRIEIESRVSWPGGSHSLYFRDPDGQAIERATPGLWEGA